MKNHLLLFIFSNLCIFLPFTFQFPLPSERFVLRLIHRDSILSPLYNKDSSISDRGNNFASSAERISQLKAKTKGPFVPYIEGTLVPNSAATVFFVNVSVGEPPVPQLLIFDTGSDLLWVQCVPCPTCRVTKEPLYNPRKSSSYAPISCHPKECKEIFDGHCGSDGYCDYAIRYRDHTNSSGTIAYEKFIIPRYNSGQAILHSVIFGCGTKHNDRVSESNGVMGLNADKASILASIGTKFSYCIGNIRDPYYFHNFLIMGDGAILDGNPTDFQIRNGFYFVTLQSIGVNHKNLTADPKKFQFNVIFDSGSTLTNLDRSLFEPFRAEVKNVLSRYPMKPVEFRNRPDLLCFIGDMEKDLPEISITLYFPGFSVELFRETLFWQVQKDAFCLAAEGQDDGWNIIGAINQQFSNFGYDLGTKKMTYRSADCEFVAKSYSL